jgi:hypothetical protein
VLGASHSILAIGITWTTVSISALGTAAGAFVAHAQLCQAAQRPMSRLRSLVLGLVFASGYMLRPDGLGAIVAALFPTLGWAALRRLRTRRLPRLGAMAAVLAPFAIVIAIQNRIPQARGADSEFRQYNLVRGQIHGQAAFEQLDQRAPELLARAGWTVQDYRDFSDWLFIDEGDYPLDKLKRLVDTGGIPTAVTWAWSYSQWRIVYDESTASVLLFVALVSAGVMLAWLRAIERWHGLAFSLGYFVFLAGVPLWMAAHYRFPQRVSLSFYTVAALGMFVYLARQIADAPAARRIRWRWEPRAAVAVAVMAVALLGWVRYLRIWLDRPAWASRDALQELDNRVGGLDAFVFVFVQAGLVEPDPLRAQPRSYDGLEGGWGTFSTPWYDTIARLGIRRGAQVFAAMRDNPNAYLLAWPHARMPLEVWIRRKLHDSSVRLAFVDGAAIEGEFRPVLYRLVTKPLERGDDEWHALARFEGMMRASLPGPPRVADLGFRSIVFAAPYEQHLAQLRQPTAGVTISPTEHGLRCMVIDESRDGCATTYDAARSGGVHIPVNGLHAARFGFTLVEPENIVSVNVYARTAGSRLVRWTWDVGAELTQFGFSGTVTLVPGYPAHQLRLVVNTARPSEIRDLDFLVMVKPGSHAGFELRYLEVANP